MSRQLSSFLTGLRRSLGVLLVVLASAASTQAEWQITEILFDTGDTSGSSNDWEWVEVLNTGTASASLNGYILDDDDGNGLGDANILSTEEVPAGSVAILHNGGDLDDVRFRAAWQLPPSVPVISVSQWPALSNGGDLVGLWSGFSDYDADLVENPDTLVRSVGGTAHAATAIDYSNANGFPAPSNDSSVYWTGSPSSTDGVNWLGSVVTDPATDGAYASTQTDLPGGTPINNVADIGNPGLVPGGTAPAKLMITEVMYNPASNENPSGSWEWVEIHNNSGAAIDFSDAGTNYFLDDNDGTALSEKNLETGSIPQGGVAILYDGDLHTPSDMNSAWGGSLNFIPVPEWPALSNGGDLLGLWGSLADYNADTEEDPETLVKSVVGIEHAEYGFEYDDNPNADPPWPSDSPQGPSIYLTDLSLDPSLGNSWAASFDGDSIGSGFAKPVVTGAVVDHEGGDVGSPGFIPFGLVTEVPGDYNATGLVEQGDLDLVLLNWGGDTPGAAWVNQLPGTSGSLTALIDQEELDRVLLNWGNSASLAATAVPEPTSLALLGSLLAVFWRRRSRS